jgi:hypothetical protein
MSGKNDNNFKFGQWLKDRRRDLRHDEKAMADLLGVAVGTLVVWEVGKTPWSKISAEYKRRIEKVCGKYPQDIDVQGLLPQEFRQEPGHISSPELALLNDPSYIGSFRESDCVMCRRPILIRDEGECTYCNRRIGGGQ